MSPKKRLTKKELKAKAADLEDKWKRAVADYLNLEKRVNQQREALSKLANARLLDKLLPVFDELEICQHHLKDQGLKIVLDKFEKVLQSEGVTEIKAEGKTFDPETMDAVEIVSGRANKVKEVVLKGYFLNDKVLRPAKVKVGGPKKEKKDE